MAGTGWNRAKLLLGIGFLMAASACWPAATAAQEVEDGFRLSTTTVRPIMPEELAGRSAPQLSIEELDELRERVEENREAVRDRYKRPPDSSLKPIGDPSIKPVTIVSGAADGARGARGNGLFIGRNERNRLAEVSGALAEPAAINNRNRVFYTGNFHFEESTDHGVTYTATHVPPGPGDAPNFCCDNDVIVDPATGTAVHIVLYIHGTDENGVLGIHVRDANAYSTVKCTYILDSAGDANNEVQDYPKAAQTLNHVFISASTYGVSAGYSRMYRVNKAELLACADLTVEQFDQLWTLEGQVAWRPAGGAEQGTLMMWANHVDATHMRIFKWPETRAAPSSVVRTVGATVFGPVDCRGGVGDFEYNEGAFSGGFTMSCAMASGVDQPEPILTCFNHSGPMINRPQAFLRGTTFKQSDRSLFAEPDLFSTDMCWGFPILTSNTRGNIGFSMVGGGNKRASSGSAVQGFVGLRTPTGTEAAMVAGGIANQASGRYGDYLTIHRYQGCPKFFGATAFAWDKAPVTEGAGINARWVEFGRLGDAGCWQRNQ